MNERKKERKKENKKERRKTRKKLEIYASMIAWISMPKTFAIASGPSTLTS
jgi:hypothetical protein